MFTLNLFLLPTWNSWSWSYDLLCNQCSYQTYAISLLLLCRAASSTFSFAGFSFYLTFFSSSADFISFIRMVTVYARNLMVHSKKYFANLLRLIWILLDSIFSNIKNFRESLKYGRFHTICKNFHFFYVS